MACLYNYSTVTATSSCTSLYSSLIALLFKNSISPSLSSGLFKAKSIVASKKPNLSPTSYLLPSKSYAYIASWQARVFNASVNCISPPLPGSWFSSISNIAGVITVSYTHLLPPYF